MQKQIITTLVRSLIVTMLVMGTRLVIGADVNWTGTNAGDDNWSTVDNWSDTINGVQADDNATFDNTGVAAASGTVTNTVDSSISIGDLIYQQFQVGTGTPSDWHTTEIPTDITLTVGGDLTVGGWEDTTYSTHTAITGSGTLLVSGGASTIGVGGQGNTRGSESEANILDLRSLTTFDADVQQILVGEIASASLDNYSTDPGERSHLYLAQNNTITASIISLQAASRFQPGSLHLGQSNTINVDNLWLGPPNRIGEMDFDSTWTDPNATFRAMDGVSRVSNIAIGWRNNPNKNQRSLGDIDFTGGTVDILVDELNMGRGLNSDNSDNFGDGVLTFSAGTIDATTITMGGGARGNADININDTATLVADTVNLGWRAESYINRDYVSETFITLGGGRLEASTINPGDTVEVSSLKYSEGGTGIDRGIIFNSGTIANKADTDLTIDALVPVTVNGAAATHAFEAQAGHMITVESVIDGDGGITKTGDGILRLNGDNTFTGDVAITEGVLQGTGSVDGGLEVQNGGTVAPGNSIGTFSVAGDAEFQTGSLLEIELGSGTGDLLAVGGILTVDENAVLSITGDYSDSPIITFSEMIGNFGTLDYNGTVFAWDDAQQQDSVGDYFHLEVTSTGISLIPEPTSLALLVMGVVGLLHRRPRRK